MANHKHGKGTQEATSVDGQKNVPLESKLDNVNQETGTSLFLNGFNDALNPEKKLDLSVYMLFLSKVISKITEPIRQAFKKDDEKNNDPKTRRGAIARWKRGRRLKKVRAARQLQLEQRALKTIREGGKPVSSVIKPKAGTLLSGKPSPKELIRRTLSDQFGMKGPLSVKTVVKGGAAIAAMGLGTKALTSGLAAYAEAKLVPLAMTGKAGSTGGALWDGAKGLAKGAWEGAKDFLPREAWSLLKEGKYDAAFTSLTHHAGGLVVGAGLAGLAVAGVIAGGALLFGATIGVGAAALVVGGTYIIGSTIADVYNSPVLSGMAKMALTSEGRADLGAMSQVTAQELVGIQTTPEERKTAKTAAINVAKEAMGVKNSAQAPSTPKIDATKETTRDVVNAGLAKGYGVSGTAKPTVPTLDAGNKVVEVDASGTGDDEKGKGEVKGKSSGKDEKNKPTDVKPKGPGAKPEYEGIGAASNTYNASRDQGEVREADMSAGGKINHTSYAALKAVEKLGLDDNAPKPTGMSEELMSTQAVMKHGLALSNGGTNGLVPAKAFRRDHRGVLNKQHVNDNIKNGRKLDGFDAMQAKKNAHSKNAQLNPGANGPVFPGMVS